ncbi:MAG: hypothetical protein IJP00_01030 [Firmicutes bacterium]|nr:hypothetical protein [Bacillota bacterium]
MKFKQFMRDTEEAVRNEIPEVLREEITVEIIEVMKTNDEILHGLRMNIPGKNSMPTVYLEDCYKEFKNGMDLKKIAEMIIELSVEAYKNAPEYADISLEYEDIRDNLIVQLLDGDMNSEHLKELVYKSVGNGFVMIAYIVISEADGNCMRTAVTKSMAEQFGYDVDAVMDVALLNTIERFEPVFCDLADLCDTGKAHRLLNPMNEEFEIAPDRGMYFLSNSLYRDGASALFYPFVAERIGELLDDNYYVLPSSLHEVIIVPASTGLTIADMKNMVKDANCTVVDKRDILSNKVLLYDRISNNLFITE